MKLKFWERFKGFFLKGPSTVSKRRFWMGELSWTERCKYNDQIFERHPLAKAQILTIAGQLMAEGVYNEAATSEVKGEYPRAKEAQRKCNDLNDQIGLDTMLYDTAVNMAKYGSCFWEKTWTPKYDVRMIPRQEAIEPAEQAGPETKRPGEITRWRQTQYGKETASWSQEEIVHFAWNITTKSWPYGTSLLIGLDTEFEILEQLETDIKEFMHKNAFPKELWQVGDGQYVPHPTEVTEIKTDVKNWEPGESFVTSYPIKREAGGAGDKTISNLNEVLNFLKDQCIDGLMVPPISKQWSSTMASAREMMPWARANLIRPMQRIIRRKIEMEVYRPYLQDLGYSVKVTPQLKWEPPDAHMDERAELYATLVGSGIITPEVAAEELGYGDKIEQMRKERDIRQEQAMQTGKMMPEEIEELLRKAYGIPQGESILEGLRAVKEQLSSKAREDEDLRRQEKKILDYLASKFGLE